MGCRWELMVSRPQLSFESHHVLLSELAASFCSKCCMQLVIRCSARVHDKLWEEGLRHCLPRHLSIVEEVAPQATTQDKLGGSRPR
jgi:hypothetical protein